jgi:hypothetical protein
MNNNINYFDMDTAVLERPVRQKTWSRTQVIAPEKKKSFENDMKPDIIYGSEIDFDTFDDWDDYDWELTEEGEKMLEEAFADLENGNVYVLHTPKNWKE